MGFSAMYRSGSREAAGLREGAANFLVCLVFTPLFISQICMISMFPALYGLTCSVAATRSEEAANACKECHVHDVCKECHLPLVPRRLSMFCMMCMTNAICMTISSMPNFQACYAQVARALSVYKVFVFDLSGCACAAGEPCQQMSHCSWDLSIFLFVSVRIQLEWTIRIVSS